MKIAAFGLIAVINLIEALPSPNLFGFGNILGNAESQVGANFGITASPRIDAGLNLTDGIDLHVSANASMEAAASALIQSETALKAVSSFQAGKTVEENYIDVAAAIDAAGSFLTQAEINIATAIALNAQVKAKEESGISLDTGVSAGLQITALAIARAQVSLKTAAALNAGLNFMGFSQFVGNVEAKTKIDAAIAAVGEARISLAAVAGIRAGVGIGGKELIRANFEGEANADVNAAADARIAAAVQ